MDFTTTHFIGPKDCPYTKGGVNLAEMRGAKLRPIAKSLEVPASGIKNDLLKGIIARLRTLEAPLELDQLK